MNSGSIHACVSACDACYDERGYGWGAVRGPHHCLSVSVFTPFSGCGSENYKSKSFDTVLIRASIDLKLTSYEYIQYNCNTQAITDLTSRVCEKPPSYTVSYVILSFNKHCLRSHSFIDL